MDANVRIRWNREKLVDLCDQITDGKHGDCQDESNSGFYFLSCKDVAHGKLNYDRARQITKDDFLDTNKRTKFAPSDILITNSGTIGRMAFAPNCELTSRTTFQKSVAILKPLVDRVEPRFLYYAIQSDIHRLIGCAGGTAQKNLLLRDLREFEVKVPPLPVQRRIAGVLSAYDELIENNQQRISILENMARTLYREWFVQFRFPGTSAESSVPGNLLDCAMGTLGDLCDLTRIPYDDAQHSELQLLDLAHIPSNTLAPQDTGNPSELTTSRIVFKKGDTLFGAIRCYLHKVVITPYPGVTNVSVLVLHPKRPEFRALLAVLASSPDTIRWADQHSTGTKMPVMNGNVFKTMPVPVPSTPTAAQFEKAAGPMLDKLCLLSIKNQNLRRTRDLLLPRLLSGQMNLPVAEESF